MNNNSQIYTPLKQWVKNLIMFITIITIVGIYIYLCNLLINSNSVKPEDIESMTPGISIIGIFILIVSVGWGYWWIDRIETFKNRNYFK